MEHFASVYTVLDCPTQTTRPGNKIDHSSECAFQFTYLLFKNSQEFAFFFNQKGETQLLCNRIWQRNVCDIYKWS